MNGEKNLVLLYNLSPEGVLPLTQQILQDRGMPFINVKSACELFTIPAFLAIVDPGYWQGKFWSVEWFELGPCFERIRAFSSMPEWFMFTQPLSIPMPDVICRRTFIMTECITTDFLQRMLAHTGAQ